MKLLFVRHGESRGNLNRQWQGWLDEPLTERGQEQAQRLAERLVRWSAESAEPIAAVYSSTLARAFQTGGILAHRWGVPLMLDWRLLERDIGALEGLTWPEVEEGYPALARTIRSEWTVAALPGGETISALAERVWQAVDEIVERSNGRGGGSCVAIVSHGGSINAYLNRLVGRSDEMPFVFRFGNTSLTMVEIHDGRPRIVLANDMCHLE
jgi:broad specificity phosphatase PhoE